jgi:hypothetical protein
MMEANQGQAEKPKRGFLWKWILYSGIGGVIGEILFLIAVMFIFIFLAMTSDAPRQSDLPPTPTNLAIGNGLIIGTLLGIAIGLPLGLVQWRMLLWKFHKSWTAWWALAYSGGLILPISAIFIIFITMESYAKMMIPVLITAWFIAGITIGGIQWLILRKLISRAFWLIPLNLISLLGFAACMAFGVWVNQSIYFFGIAIGGVMGGALYGAIIGIPINRAKEQTKIADAATGEVQL